MTKLPKIRVLCSNVRGLGSQHKRKDVIHYLKDIKCDILLLQDTHLTEDKVSLFNSLWDGKAYHSCHTNNSRGTSILVSKNLQHDVINKFANSNGNYLVLECKIGADTYLIGSIY